MVDTWRYPADWRAISRRIRERDGYRCRWCGIGGTLFDLRTMRPIRLTAMHLDRDPGNNEEWNLVTACRPCHAAYDAPDLAVARNEARLRTRIGAGQLELFHMGEFERL
jgi:5-methylcytosine-specific restriction endonuclease McrA